MSQEKSVKLITSNKKAHFNYFLSDFTECGLVLVGTEIKSLRWHGCSLNDAYVVIRNGEMEVLNNTSLPPLRSTRHASESPWLRSS